VLCQNSQELFFLKKKKKKEKRRNLKEDFFGIIKLDNCEKD
jgi:hypothetical protein